MTELLIVVLFKNVGEKTVEMVRRRSLQSASLRPGAFRTHLPHV